MHIPSWSLKRASAAACCGAELEREQQVVHSATELWQAHHDRLLQENGEAKQRSEEQLRSISAGFEQSQAALLADLAEARSAQAAQTQQIQQLQAARVCLLPHNTRPSGYKCQHSHLPASSMQLSVNAYIVPYLQDEAAKRVAAAEQTAAAAQQSCAAATATNKVPAIRSLMTAHNAQ